MHTLNESGGLDLYVYNEAHAEKSGARVTLIRQNRLGLCKAIEAFMIRRTS